MWGDPWAMRPYYRHVFDPETGWGMMNNAMRDMNRIERFANQLVDPLIGETQQALGQVNKSYFFRKNFCVFPKAKVF